MKYAPLFAAIVLAVCTERASAQVFLYNGIGAPATGAITFNDTASGGTTTTVTAPALVGDQPMNGLLWMNYSSITPHVDSASMALDITQAPFPSGPASMPWFAATASLSQAAAVTGNTATLSATVSSGFEGLMTGVNPSSLLALMAYSVSGIVGTNPGAFASMTATLNYNQTVGGAPIGKLIWNFSTTTPGAFSVPVIPVWVAAPSPILTSNLVTVSGTITLQADPSSISIAPLNPVPEPTTLVSALLGAAALAGRRRRAN